MGYSPSPSNLLASAAACSSANFLSAAAFSSSVPLAHLRHVQAGGRLGELARGPIEWQRRTQFEKGTVLCHLLACNSKRVTRDRASWPVRISALLGTAAAPSSLTTRENTSATPSYATPFASAPSISRVLTTSNGVVTAAAKPPDAQPHSATWYGSRSAPRYPRHARFADSSRGIWIIAKGTSLPTVAPKPR